MSKAGKPNVSTEDIKCLSVFISYSRNNIDVAEKVRLALHNDGFDVFLDKYEITVGEDWRSRLHKLILTADVVVFLISPESSQSETCTWEVQEAIKFGKRIFPVIIEGNGEHIASNELKTLNYTFLNSENSWLTDYPKLIHALKTDLPWVRENTRLLELAHRWEEDQKSEKHLLRYEAIINAEAHCAKRPTASPNLPSLLIEYIDRSRVKELKDRNNLRRLVQRSFVQPAEKAIKDGCFDAATRLLAAGALLSDDPNFDLDELATEPGKHSLWRAAACSIAQPTRPKAILTGHSSNISCFDISQDSSLVLTATYNGVLRIWKAKNGNLIHSLRGHTSGIGIARFSSDGKLALTGGNDGTNIVWNVQDGSIKSKFSGHFNSMVCGRLFHTKDLVISAGYAREDRKANLVCLWDHSKGELVWKQEIVGDRILIATVCPNDKFAVTATDKQVFIWDIETARGMYLETSKDTTVSYLCINRTGTFVLTAHKSVEVSNLNAHIPDGAVHLWDLSSGRHVSGLKNLVHGVMSLALAPDGDNVVVADLSGRLATWNLTSGELIHQLPLRGKDHNYRFKFDFSPDGQKLAVAGGNRILWLFDVNTGKEVAQYRGHTGPITDIKYSPNGEYIATRGGSYPQPAAVHQGNYKDHTVRLWDVFNDEPQRIIQSFKDLKLWGLKIDNDEKHMLCMSNLKVTIVDISNNFKIAEFDWKNQSTQSVASFDQLGKYVLLVSERNSISKPGYVMLWDFSAKAKPILISKIFSLVALLPLAKGYVQVVAQKSLEIAWINKNSESRFDYSHASEVAVLAFCNNAELLVSADIDGYVAIHSMINMKCIAAFRTGVFSPETIAVSKLGDRVFIAQDCNNGFIYSRCKDRPIETSTSDNDWCELVHLREHVSFMGGPLRGVFSPSGTILATGSIYNSDVCIWDAISGARLATLSGHTKVISLEYSQNGCSLYVGENSGAVKVWDVSRWNSFTGSRIEYLVPALDNGLGHRSVPEKVDLLMQDAPDDLYKALRHSSLESSDDIMTEGDRNRTILNKHSQSLVNSAKDHAMTAEDSIKNVGVKMERVILNIRALFPSNSDQLTKQGRRELLAQVDKLKSYSTIELIDIVGHTDNRGTTILNLGLSERRTTTIKVKLQTLQRSFPLLSIATSSLGESLPIADNESDEGRRQNRRAEIRIEGFRYC